MHPEAKEQLRAWFKLNVLEYGKIFGATEACKDFNVAISSYYYWKKKFDSEGKAGLYRKKPVAYTHPKKTKPKVVEKILELRTVYKMGAFIHNIISALPPTVWLNCVLMQFRYC